jgi:hypothetical protein
MQDQFQHVFATAKTEFEKFVARETFSEQANMCVNLAMFIGDDEGGRWLPVSEIDHFLNRFEGAA